MTTLRRFGAPLALAVLIAGCGGESDDATWGAPSQIAGVGSLSAVSCATAHFCVAVGGRDAVTFRNGRWLAPRAIDTRGRTDALQTVSCPAVDVCVAGDGAGRSFTLGPAGWSGPLAADPAGLREISCAAPRRCAAVDDDGDVLRFDGTRWSAPSAVPESSGVAAISCAGPSFCMAVDDGDAQAHRLAGSGWSNAGTLALSTPARGSEPDVPDAVACTSASFCAALDKLGETFTWRGDGWSNPFRFDRTLVYGGGRLSCPSAEKCIAVADNAASSSWDGSDWTPGRRIDVLTPTDVSCATPVFCVAVDVRGRAVVYR